MLYIEDATYVELKAEIAEALLQAQGLPIIWVKDEHGNQRMNEETQLRFKECYDSTERLLQGKFFAPDPSLW